MPKCVHCGEPVDKGQEMCFACGQRARARVRRGSRPVNPSVFLFAGVLVLVVAVGFIIIHSGRAKRTRSEVQKQHQLQLRDSSRQATQARRDTVKAVIQNQVAAVLTDEIDKIDQRFSLVKRQVVKDQPSPAQTKLITQIRTEMIRLRQLTVTVADQPGTKGDSIKAQVRDGERVLRNLISDLSRAPKK
ncbi:MAG: zinc ribbon domain-containing protein [candidate division WOR-3 bacterium]|nr:zinc ribbon domain-containing protein [candidate division WOR-3 bacterium]